MRAVATPAFARFSVRRRRRRTCCNMAWVHPHPNYGVGCIGRAFSGQRNGGACAEGVAPVLGQVLPRSSLLTGVATGASLPTQGTELLRAELRQVVLPTADLPPVPALLRVQVLRVQVPQGLLRLSMPPMRQLLEVTPSPPSSSQNHACRPTPEQ